MREELTVGLRGLPAPYRRTPDNLFVRLLERSFGLPIQIVSSSRRHVDIAVTSTHPPDWRRVLAEARALGSRRLRLSETTKRLNRWDFDYSQPTSSASVNIWTSGENIRPPEGAWDLYLSHDSDGLGGRNIYVPFWMEAIGTYAPPTVNFLGVRPTLDEMLSPREANPSERSGFACAFLGKNSGMRSHAINALGMLGKVDVFGPAVGRPVGNKATVAKDYKFMLCFENDLYPGYVTEKPFDAWATGAVPLYWGNDASNYLNPRALINLADFDGLEPFVGEVAMIMQDAPSMAEIASEPILLRPPDMTAIERSIREKVAPLLGLSD